MLALISLLLLSCAPQQPGSPGQPATPVQPTAPSQNEPAKQAVKPAEKTKLAVSYLDDPSRDTVLYAIRQGIVKSDKIDVELTFLPLPAAVEAYQTKKFDVIEASPVAVAASAAAGFKTVIVSAALENKAGTILFVPADSSLKDPRELKGKTIGLGSLGGTFALEARYVLQEKYGLNTNPQGGDVRWQEIPPDATLGLLKENKLDAAVMLHIPAWKLQQDRDFRVLAEVTKDFVQSTSLLSMNSVLLTYPEVAQQKGPAIQELNRILRESADYARSNQDQVNAAVAREKNVPVDFLKWWWSVYDYPQGSLTDQHKKEITSIWQVANKLGIVKEVPPVDDYALKS